MLHLTRMGSWSSLPTRGLYVIVNALLLFIIWLNSSYSTSSNNFEQPASSLPKSSVAGHHDRPLILYAYSESSYARPNLEFFIEHGLHASADFVFVFNGETNASSLLPKEANIRYIARENKCWDLGAYGEVLRADNLWKKYKRFIMLNASIRGPFIPHWANSCWSESYLGKVTDKVKLVGMTMNCWPNPHVQSMIWATDSVGIDLLLHPPPSTPSYNEWMARMPHVAGWKPATEIDDNYVVGLNTCFRTYYEAVSAEVGATSIIMGAGYKVDVMLTRFHSDPNYIDTCDPNHTQDMLLEKGYNGTNVHPYETIFAKTNRGIDPTTLNLLSAWTDGAKYSSYDVC